MSPAPQTKRLRKALVSVVLPAIALNTAGAAQAEPISEREVRAAVTATVERMRTDRAYLEGLVNKGWMGRLSPQQLPVVVAMVREITDNARMHDYLVQVIRPMANDATTRDEITATIAEAISTLQAKGMRRVSADQQATMVRFTYDWAGWLPPKACKAMFTGQLNTVQTTILERSYALALPQAQFERYIAMYKVETLAELNDYPAPRVVNDTQRKGSDRAFKLAFAAKIAALPAGVLERVGDDPENAEPADACLFLRQTLSAMLAMDEPYRTWQLAKFIVDVQ